MQVTYIGCSKEQVTWGSNDDPNGLLTVGETYNVKSSEECAGYFYRTKIELVEFPGKFFNSVCFR